MAKITTRECPQCHKTKPFREDQVTCGCPKPKEPSSTDTTSKSGRVREINIEGTRICNEEQLIEALDIDLTKWYVDTFTVRKWEMGFVSSQHAETVKADTVKTQTGKKGFKRTRTVTGDAETNKEYTPDHHQLFAVACKLKRVVTEKDNDGYVKENARLMKENRRVKFQLEAEKRYRTALVDNGAKFDETISQIKDLAGELGQVKLQPFAIKQLTPAFSLPIKSTHTEDAVLLLSDWHCGDVIRPGDTSGFPEFDLTICGNRIGYNIRKAKSILTMHRAMYPIKTLYVWFGGDMGNGDLHDAPLSNALFIGPQVDFTFKMAKFAVEDLLSLTVPDAETGVRVVDEIVLLFTCGNHMRESTAKFMPMKYQAQRTFDWLIYQMLIEFFKGTPRLTVKQSMSPYIFENIRGHRYGFAHGMQVGYRNSPDAQANSMDGFLKLVRSLFDSPEFRRKNGLDGPTFSRFCIGDIHVPVRFPRLVSNGSMNGQNELGVNWGLEPIPAGQQLFGVSESHLETWAYFIECSQVQKEPDDFNQYGHFAGEYERQFGRK